MSKVVGACLVISGALGLGASRCRDRESRLQLLESWISSLREIARQIAETHAPLPQILKYLSDRGPAPLRVFFRESAAALDSARWEAFPGVWQSRCERHFSMLPESAGAVISELGSVLGRLVTGEQCEALTAAGMRLEEIRRELRREIKDEKRTTLALAGAAGVIAVVLLL